MNVKLIVSTSVLLLSLSLAMGDIITATSNSFIFPQITGVKDGKLLANSGTYFKHSGFSQKSGIVTFSWSVPGQVNVPHGTIAIYSMQGRMIKSISIASASGTVSWNTSKKIGLGGVYVAKLTIGSYKENLKLMLCK
jgi:hypothetical protein